jgi:hypothetical protein
MKTLLKKGTRQINQEKREECLKNWGTIAYGTPNASQTKNNAINMNDIFHSRASKTTR